MPRGQRSARLTQPDPSLSPVSPPAPQLSAGRTQPKKRTVADNAKAIDVISTQLETMSSLLSQVVGQLRPPADVVDAQDIDSDYVAERVPRTSAGSRTRHRSDFPLNDSLFQPRARHNSVVSSASSARQPDTRCFTPRGVPYTRPQMVDPLGVVSTRPSRRDMPTTLQDLDGSTELQDRVAHLISATIAPPHLAGKKLFAHSYVRRGAKKTRTTMGDLSLAEYNLGFVRFMNSRETDPADRPFMFQHLEHLNEDAIVYPFSDVRAWDPLDYPLMGVCHQGAYYTDICPSFGSRGSSMAQQRVSEATCYLMAQEGHHVLAYVDDFCGIHSAADQALAGFNTFFDLTAALGLQLAEDKCAPPATTMEWLGFLFDTRRMSITIPPAKLQEILDLAGDWASRKRASRRDLQRLAGKLNHISQCLLPARKFMGRILATLRAAPQVGTILVGDELRRDIQWFIRYARQCNGRLLMTPTLPTFEIQCDACPEGGGGFSREAYYSARYPPQLAEQHHISRIEALNIVVAIKTLVPEDMRSTELIITTDNSAAMHTINTGKTKDPTLAACSRELWLFAALRELRITINHAPGATLVLADALSRRHKSQEFEDVVTQMTRHLGITQIAPCDIAHALTPDL